MISKNKLQSVIAKYHLGGRVESVKWEVYDNSLNIDFMSATKDMIGNLTCDDFALNENGILAIFNTTQLSKLLNVLNGELLLDATRTKAILTKLNIQDNRANVVYSLADEMMIQRVGTPNEPPYHVECEIENEDFQTFIRAAAAIAGNELVSLAPTKDSVGQDVLTFVFGDRMEHSNKVELAFPATFLEGCSEGRKYPFNSEVLKDIFTANKDSDKATIKFYQEGLVRIDFRIEEDGISTTYFVVGKAE